MDDLLAALPPVPREHAAALHDAVAAIRTRLARLRAHAEKLSQPSSSEPQGAELTGRGARVQAIRDELPIVQEAIATVRRIESETYPAFHALESPGRALTDAFLAWNRFALALQCLVESEDAAMRVEEAAPGRSAADTALVTEAVNRFRAAMGSARERVVTLFLLPRDEKVAVAREVAAELHVAETATDLLEMISNRQHREDARWRPSLPSFWEHRTPWALARTLAHRLRRAWSDMRRRRWDSSINDAVRALRAETSSIQIDAYYTTSRFGYPPWFRRALLDPPSPARGGPPS